MSIKCENGLPYRTVAMHRISRHINSVTKKVKEKLSFRLQSTECFDFQ